ncbi:MAG: hypothetical protein ABJH28_06650 [Paraglaciecola sp.]|uniref:hypothetical protein n=1 Tax=Paraglaciecola sp. TaxID=1920173 RepID=UPI003267435E
MLKHLTSITFIFIILLLNGCAGLGNMKEVKFEQEIASDMAMVNIVRRAVFMGDGAKVEAWDGEQFIGSR